MRFVGYLILLMSTGLVALYVFLEGYQGRSVLISSEKIFEVGQGESLHSVGRKLEHQGIIASAFLFVKVGQLNGYDKIHFGEYRITPNDKMSDLYQKLTLGSTLKYELVFTEGSHIFELTNQLDRLDLIDRQKFTRLIKDGPFIQKLLNERQSSLEGYLFPDTYYFSKTDGEKKIIKTMVDRFFNVYDNLKTGSSSLSRHQLITLASIIEKETGAGFERAKISSVFHNRMLKKMRLQTDPTVIYGLLVQTGVETKNITKKDLKTKTPYNTYLISGLPPGPIGNPGEEALKAALSPENTKYLYFVSRNDGTHIFTTNYKDHLAAVRKFQLDPKMRKGKSWRDLGKKQ